MAGQVWKPEEIGPIYDVGLALRTDNDTLHVLGRQGTPLDVNRIAFMCSTQLDQEEATELQEKQKLVQLQTSILDREFDQWVQDTQQDWSGGMLQRLKGGQGSDPTRYWDGTGLLWPVADFLPQQPYQPAVINPPVASTGSYQFVAGGGLAGFPGWTTVYSTAAGHEISFRRTADNEIDASNLLGATVTPFSIDTGDGNLWVLGQAPAASLRLYQVNFQLGTGLVLARSDDVSQGDFSSTPSGTIASGRIGNKFYVACALKYVTTTAGKGKQYIRLFDFSQNQGFTLDAPVGFVDLSIGNAITYSSVSGVQGGVTDMAFLGDNLYVALNDAAGLGTAIMAFNIPTQQWLTAGYLSGAQAVGICAVAGGLFIVSSPLNGNWLNLYLLQGQSLQDIGTIPQSLSRDLLKPVGMAGYVLFGVTLIQPSGSGAVLQVYAYDVLRGRLFRVFNQNYSGAAFVGQLANRLPIYGGVLKGSPIAVTSQWTLALPLLGLTSQANLMQELLVGAIQSQLPASPILLRGPVDIISSAVDFTSAQPKLFRQVLATFTQLPDTPQQGVTLSAWLDKDPLDIVAGAGLPADFGPVSAAPGSMDLSLPINRIGRKLVYRITTTGGTTSATQYFPAVKLLSVSVQSASGWVWHLYLLLSRAAQVNSGSTQDSCFDRQGLDEIAAYNWLKALWRSRGGECRLTMPNGDSYPAKLQMGRWKMKKPFVQPDAGHGQRYETVVEIIVREDMF